MRLLVCGSRDFPSQYYDDLLGTIRAIHIGEPISVIIEGGASGADAFASRAARDLDIPSIRYKADWTLGKAAGPTKMLVDGKPDRVLAFTTHKTPSKGTQNMIDQAKTANIPVWHAYMGMTLVLQK